MLSQQLLNREIYAQQDLSAHVLPELELNNVQSALTIQTKVKQFVKDAKRVCFATP